MHGFLKKIKISLHFRTSTESNRISAFNRGFLFFVFFTQEHILHIRKIVNFCHFCQQEKMKGKNKLVPRLLGITKESVMRVDEKTKDVVQEWPLTTVKRWAASPKSFTLVLRCAVWRVMIYAAWHFQSGPPWLWPQTPAARVKTSVECFHESEIHGS